MSLQEIGNRIRRVEARIGEIERRAAAFETPPGPDGPPASETPFAKALEAETRRIGPRPRLMRDQTQPFLGRSEETPKERTGPPVNGKPAAPAAGEDAPIVVPPARPRVAAPPAVASPPLPDDGLLSPRLVSTSVTAVADAENVKIDGGGRARAVPDDILPALLEAAKRYRIDPALVAAMIDTESNWNRKAVSGKGALGLMQLMPGTADDMGVEDPFDPEENIFGGVRYLRRLLDRFPTKEQALAAYNAGPERVERAGGVPDIRETRDYVERVLSRYALRMNGDLGEEEE